MKREMRQLEAIIQIYFCRLTLEAPSLASANLEIGCARHLQHVQRLVTGRFGFTCHLFIHSHFICMLAIKSSYTSTTRSKIPYFDACHQSNGLYAKSSPKLELDKWNDLRRVLLALFFILLTFLDWRGMPYLQKQCSCLQHVLLCQVFS